MSFVYAINRSSLGNCFIDDSNEMLKAMKEIDGSQRLLVYRTDNAEKTGIYEAQYIDHQWTWKLLKEYERTVTSTDPDRMNQVMKDAIAFYPDAAHSLFFWGHGSSWTPTFSSHSTGITKATGKTDGTEMNAFGGEYGENNMTDYIDLTDLVKAVPSDAFDIIWFDVCYMASVEVAYQFRDKCKWFIAYPTEVWDSGLNYDKILPVMMKKDPEIEKAARIFFDYYDLVGDPVTVSVMDMTKIEPLAEISSRLFINYPVIPDVTVVSNYGRGQYYYYDFLQFMADRCGEENIGELQKALSDFIVYHSESATNFKKKPWERNPLCGISIHNFTNKGDRNDNYYKTLDWYMRMMK